MVVLASSVFCCSALAVAAEATKEVSTRVKPKTLKTKTLKATPASPVEKADLTIQSISIISGYPQVGKTMKLVVTVWNSGKKPSTITSLNLKLRQGTIAMSNPPAPAFSRTVSIGAIDPNRARAVTFTKTLTNWPTGFWTAEARVDPQNRIFESNENNNISRQGFKINQ